MTKVFQKDLTSYDFIKVFAVIFMVIDHAGYYFFLDDMWWRVLGRLCVPVWFFLIGYANSRDLRAKLWIGAAVLQFSNFPTGNYILPLNVLATMIAIRLVIDPVMEHAMRSRQTFWSLCVMFVILIFPSSMVMEYGTLGLLLAMFGWLVRRRDHLKEPEKLMPQFLMFLLLCFVLMEQASFGFSQLQFLVLSVGMMLVMGTLYFFESKTYPRLSAALPWIFKAPIQLMGRYTLEIYVLHLILFKTLAVFMEPQRFVPFHWSLFPHV